MAIDDQIDDEEPEVKPKKKSNLLLIILSVITVLLLVVISVGATMFMTGALSGDTASTAQSGDEQTGEDKKSKKNKKKDANNETKKPLYVELGEPLVVNFVEDNQIRYLQVKMEVMTREELMPEKIKDHLPLIKNNLLMMLSGLDYETISSFSGKQKIRDEALAEIQSIMKEQTGEKGVEALYFTSFVIQ